MKRDSATAFGDTTLHDFIESFEKRPIQQLPTKDHEGSREDQSQVVTPQLGPQPPQREVAAAPHGTHNARQCESVALKTNGPHQLTQNLHARVEPLSLSPLIPSSSQSPPPLTPMPSQPPMAPQYLGRENLQLPLPLAMGTGSQVGPFDWFQQIQQMIAYQQILNLQLASQYRQKLAASKGKSDLFIRESLAAQRTPPFSAPDLIKDQYTGLKVDALKAILKWKRLKRSGTKAELLARLRAASNTEPVVPPFTADALENGIEWVNIPPLDERVVMELKSGREIFYNNDPDSGSAHETKWTVVIAHHSSDKCIRCQEFIPKGFRIIGLAVPNAAQPEYRWMHDSCFTAHPPTFFTPAQVKDVNWQVDLREETSSAPMAAETKEMIAVFKSS